MTDPKPRAKRAPTSPDPAPTSRTWIGSWVRSESWWRDVASQAVGGVIVLIVGAAVAAVTAWIAIPEVGSLVGYIALVALRVLGFIAVSIGTFAGFVAVVNAWSRRYPTARQWQVGLFVVPMFLLVGGILGVAYWLLIVLSSAK